MQNIFTLIHVVWYYTIIANQTYFFNQSEGGWNYWFKLLHSHRYFRIGPMKHKAISVLIAALATTSVLSMTAFAYGDDYIVYDAASNTDLFIALHDYPGETIESFCEKYGYQLVAKSDDPEALSKHKQETGARDSTYGVLDETDESMEPESLTGVAPTTASSTESSASAASSTEETSATAASSVTETTVTPTATKKETAQDAAQSAEKTAKADASHGPYDGITEEAKEAFIGFTSDSKPDSCYIDVYKDSDNLVMPKDAIAYTKANREDGIVNLVDSNGEPVVSFTFPQVDVSEDIDLNCDITVSDGVYGIAFKNESNPGCNVIIKLPLSERNTQYHIYDSEGAQFFDVTTDDDGYAKFAVMTLSKYQITTGDYVEEAMPISDVEVEDGSEESSEGLPVTEELTKETAEDETPTTTMPEIAVTPESTSSSLFTFIPVILAAVAVAIVGAWFFTFKKK